MGALLETALVDSIALSDAARQAGVTFEQARVLAAVLGELPAPQAIRICGDAAKTQQRRRRHHG